MKAVGQRFGQSALVYHVIYRQGAIFLPTLGSTEILARPIKHKMAVIAKLRTLHGHLLMHSRPKHG